MDGSHKTINYGNYEQTQNVMEIYFENYETKDIKKLRHCGTTS